MNTQGHEEGFLFIGLASGPFIEGRDDDQRIVIGINLLWSRVLLILFLLPNPHLHLRPCSGCIQLLLPPILCNVSTFSWCLTVLTECRNCYQTARSWSKCGEARGNVYTNLRNNSMVSHDASIRNYSTTNAFYGRAVTRERVVPLIRFSIVTSVHLIPSINVSGNHGRAVPLRTTCKRL